MNKQIFKYSSAVALLLNSSAAKGGRPLIFDKASDSFPGDGVTNHPDGHGGPAPCLESYIYVEGLKHMGDDAEPLNILGEIPHAYHGSMAADGAVVATGNSNDGGFIYKGPRGDC